MEYLKWLYKFSRFLLYRVSQDMIGVLIWIADKAHDKNVTWKSLKNEFKGFFDGKGGGR